MDRFGTILVRASYLLAGLIAVVPLIAIVLDWNDPGHLNRLVICIPFALVIAVLGKILACVIAIADSKKEEL